MERAPIEKTIWKAIRQIEELWADERLTKAQTLMMEADRLVKEVLQEVREPKNGDD